MDENTHKRIEELKKNPPNRLLPVLLIPVAMAGVFCYRVATTDPQWPAAAPQPAAAPAKPAAVQPAKQAAPVQSPAPAPAPAALPAKQAAPVQSPAPAPAPAALTAKPAKPAATDQPAAATPAEAVPPASAPSEAKSAAVEHQSDSPRPEAAPSEANDSAALDAYLSEHLNRQVPFLYKGEQRTVTIVAYTEETVTIKRKKIFTLKRSDLSPEQLALWK